MKKKIFYISAVLLLAEVSLKSKHAYSESEYIIQPHVIEKEKLPVNVTRTALNWHVVDHIAEGQADVGIIYGDNFDIGTIYGDHRKENIFLNLTYTVSSKVEQSLSDDQIFTSDYQGKYLQFKTATKNNEIILTETSPQTMMGMGLQMSFTGSCSVLDPNAPPDKQCAFTPSLITDRNSIDPKYFVPTRIEQKGNIGDEISEKSIAVLAQPGFQSRGADGQYIGLDLYLPNIGATPGNSISDTSSMKRKEKIENTALAGYSRVRKIIRSNYAKSVMGVTVHGFGGVWDGDNIEINMPLAAGAQILPDVDPSLVGSDKKANTNINNNLFNAASNTRLPDNSWTIYQAGLGSADHASVQDGLAVLPRAYFNTLWLGLSPVRETSSSYRFYYDPVGPERVLTHVGGEGGASANISFLSATDQQTINSQALDEFYVQAYLTMYARDVNFIGITTLNYETVYYPHLSYSGNLTGTSYAWRYYTGLLFTDIIKSYIGTDYTRHFWKNWLYTGAVIGYLNPDQDYYSRLESELSRRIGTWRKNTASVFTGFRYAFDRQDKDDMLDLTDYLRDPVDNVFNIGVGLNLNSWAEVKVAYNVGDVLPDSVDSSWSVSGNIKASDYIILQAFFTPYTSQESYGCSASIDLESILSKKANLMLGWKHQTYEYGSDPFDHQMTTEHDYYTLGFSYRW
ncbi:hypothetical protein VU08_03915 [Desulfobulbus sp. F5]|nr:hypothetical protein [Desulfobulbus sp. F5]